MSDLLNREALGLKVRDVVEDRKRGDPPIMVFAPNADVGIINLEVQTLRDEEDIVVDRLTKLLRR